jgi:hypothetical protein
MFFAKNVSVFLVITVLSLFLFSRPVTAANLDELEQFWLEQFNDTEVERPLNLSGNFGTFTRELLAKAQPDECYDGIGIPYPPGPPCAQGIPKVNEGYVWGLTKAGDDLWIGTLANTHCLAIGGMMSLLGLGNAIPHENTSWVCEFGESQLVPPMPPFFGDWRMPHIYVFDLTTETLTDKTPLPFIDPLIQTTLGLRSAGNLNNVVILGGPSLVAGINLFAYRADTGAYIGSINLPQYDNIRKWVVIDGVLYAGVKNTAGGGSVLRWKGDLINPFQFDVVGNLDNDAVELAKHEGRLFATTWPSVQLAGPPAPLAGLYMSPVIPFGGLTPTNANNWTKVWKTDDYEPDPVTATTYAGGALASYGGYLYWGTMHVPFTSAMAALASLDLDSNGNGDLDPEEILITALGTYRAISIFRGRNFGARAERMEVVYGLSYLPIYDPIAKSYTIAFDAAHRNKMPDPVPKWGLSGFGNFFNVYTWTMAVYDNELFIGTFDWSYLLAQGLLDLVLTPFVSSELPPECKSLQAQVQWPKYVFGADLYRIIGGGIRSGKDPALPESVAGVGNFTNYGIRTMVSDDALYLGTANPMNLLTDLTDPLPEGGWELIKLKKADGEAPPPAPPYVRQ